MHFKVGAGCVEVRVEKRKQKIRARCHSKVKRSVITEKGAGALHLKGEQPAATSARFGAAERSARLLRIRVHRRRFKNGVDFDGRAERQAVDDLHWRFADVIGEDWHLGCAE